MFMRDTQPPLDLESFCHAEHPRLVRLLSLHTGDVETARDLAQETLVKVCVHWRKVRSLDTPQAWVTRVALNLATSHHRRSAVRRRHAGEDRAYTGSSSTRDDEGWMVRAAIASILYTGRLETGRPTLGAGNFLLDVIGATVIGGTSLFGGKGKIIWTFFGVLFFVLLSNTLNLMNLSTFHIDMVKGGVILMAALLDVVRTRLLRTAT